MGRRLAHLVWITLALCTVAAGCSSGPDLGFAIAATIDFDDSIDDASVARATKLVITTTGDEQFQQTLALTRATFRTERVVYRPLATTRSLFFDVTAMDSTGEVIATGGAQVMGLDPGKTTTLAVVLFATSTADLSIPNDLGASDLGANDLGPARYTRSIDVKASVVTSQVGSLTDYPVLVSLNEPWLKSVGSGGRIASQTGSDIYFAASGAELCPDSGSCALDYEIESYDSVSGTLVAWVRLPTLHGSGAGLGDTKFSIHYGDASGTTPPPKPSAVFDVGFRGIWHMSDTGTTSVLDSRNNFTGARFNVTSATGKMGNGFQFAGAGYVEIPDAVAIHFGANADFAVSAWVNTQQGAVDWYPRIVSKADDTPPRQGLNLILHTVSNNDSWFGEFFSNGTESGVTGATPIADGTWHYLAMVREGTSLRAYQDGALVMSKTVVAGDTTNTLPLRFGALASATPSQFFVGIEDEVRLSAVPRYADWIATDYAVQSDPANALIVGAETSP